MRAKQKNKYMPMQIRQISKTSSSFSSYKSQKRGVYQNISKEVKKKFIHSLLTESKSIKLIARQFGIKENSAKFIWQQYKRTNKIKERKQRIQYAKSEFKVREVFSKQCIELKKTLQLFPNEVSPGKNFFKSYTKSFENPIMFNPQFYQIQNSSNFNTEMQIKVEEDGVRKDNSLIKLEENEQVLIIVDQIKVKQEAF